ncbi:MAG TPA: DNA polymerase IV [Elusimicrobia bacterium]|nr:DNA polymerase IV [Elusimicrobiota bacterium]HBT62705.1 DNA polymerase IV [Elusimicrobiota bacterium]
MHVDMDCFFAAVEERENPALKGKPVIVGSDPKGGKGRGIVATCNYEARRYGLHSAMPISIAYRKCPHGVYLHPRFPLYSQVSRRVMDILRRHADVLEPGGIDEAYLDVSSRGGFAAARDLGFEIRARILDQEKLSASIGVGPNKLIAKIASDHRKPGGLTIVIARRVEEFLGPKSVGVLRGVGPKTRVQLEAMGYRTVSQLLGASQEDLAREFGKFGIFLWREARGQDDRPVDPNWIQKSIGREITFETDTRDAEEIKTRVLQCVREVHGEMTADGHWCRTLTVKIRFEGYETHSRQTTLPLASGSLAHLSSGALALLEPFLARGRRVRLVGFAVSNFVPPEDLLPLE